MDVEMVKDKIRTLGCVVLIPTYNNERTLLKVIDDVRAYSDNIMVVNDGSTDSTPQLLDGLENVTVVSYERNRGKGYAIRRGLKEAMSMGYRYAITIDSDGQHYADDIPMFVEEIEKTPDTLLIGARNLRADNMPSKNTFANKFSNFWYWAETGIRLSDTQSGFRLYPLVQLANAHYITSRYEFEVEIIVKAAWKGLNVRNIPIKVYYPPEGERVSHFRPAKDFTRISLLNTYLVLLALLFFLPWRFVHSLTRENIQRFIRENITASDDSNMRMSLAIGLGAMCGVLPVWGFQMWIALAVAHLCRLNKVVTFVFTNISVPPVIPFILFGGYCLGAFVYGNPVTLLFSEVSVDSVMVNLTQYITGSLLLALIVGLLFWLGSYLLFVLFGRRLGE